MVVNADVRDMRGHAANRVLASTREAFLIARGIKMKDRNAVAEALGPLGPSARRVFAAYSENGRTLAFIILAVDGCNLGLGE